MAEPDTDTELSHYGKKGMKWGVRKSGSVKKASAAKRTSKDHKEAAKIKQKKTSEMSNEELKTLTKRMQLEKSYKELNPHKMSTGKKYLAAALGTYAMANTIVSIPSSPAYKVGKKIVNNIRS